MEPFIDNPSEDEDEDDDLRPIFRFLDVVSELPSRSTPNLENDAFDADTDDIPTPPAIETPQLSEIENLATTQKFISLIANATFEEEERQWKESEFQNFLKPPKFWLEIDEPHLCLSLKTYLTLSG